MLGTVLLTHSSLFRLLLRYFDLAYIILLFTFSIFSLIVAIACNTQLETELPE
jgi:hypothetical protein